MKKFLFFALSALFCLNEASAKEFVVIGTGSVTGTYYPVGGAICRLVLADGSVNCMVESTGGSVANIEKVTKKDVNFGFVQSDIVYDNYNGKGKFEGKANKNLRAVAAIYPELLAFIVSKSANITSYETTAGKRVNPGNPGSGNEVTSTLVFNELGVDMGKFAKKSEFDAGEAQNALKNGEIDGYFYMVGHPAKNIAELAQNFEIDLVGIDADKAKAITEKYPYYAIDMIPANTYEGVKHSTNTLGVKAVLVTDASESDENVRAVVKAILDHFEDYHILHKALANVTMESLLDGLSAPLHPVAEEEFRKAGLLK